MGSHVTYPNVVTVPVRRNFKNNLRRLIIRKGVSVEELQQRTNISKKQIRGFVNGEFEPTISYAFLLCLELNIELDPMLNEPNILKFLENQKDDQEI